MTDAQFLQLIDKLDAIFWLLTIAFALLLLGIGILIGRHR